MTDPADDAAAPGAQGRIASLDLIRGVAVLGIVFANIVAFAQPAAAYIWPRAMPGGGSTLDEALWLVQYVLVDHKMRGLFTLLFGAGMVLFVERAAARGAGRLLQLRRLLLLLVFGAAHYYLLWDGDILQSYALWGMVALLLVGRTGEVQLGLGLALYALGTIALAVSDGASWIAATRPGLLGGLIPPELASRLAGAEAATLRDSAAEIARVARESYADGVRLRWQESGANLELILTAMPETLGLILIGMGLYRLGFFSAGTNPGRLRTWGWRLLLAGAGLSAALGIWAWGSGFDLFLTVFVFEGLMMLPRLAYSLGLAALLVVAVNSRPPNALIARFSAAGRMAFSNYIGTSLVMLPLFASWGLGLFGTLHRGALLAIVVAVWAAMLVGSPAWLARFHYGPLEWLWRCLTYGRWMPLRR